MLASITPLGERGRGARWGVTVSALLLGALAAGAAAGALLGAAGALLLDGVALHVRLIVLAGAAALALAADLAPVRLPGPRRQVDHGWLDRYRGWVYGVGYGAQFGVGVATIVSSAATYLALLAALLAGGAGRGALIAGTYGALRGLTPLAAARVQRPEQLLALHRALARWSAPAQRAMGALLLGIAAAGCAGALV